MIEWFKKYKDIDKIHFSMQLPSKGKRGNVNAEKVSTIVILKDGRKGQVRPRDGEDDFEKAILYAYVKAKNAKTGYQLVFKDEPISYLEIKNYHSGRGNDDKYHTLMEISRYLMSEYSGRVSITLNPNDTLTIS